jgi:hypothetical protein
MMAYILAVILSGPSILAFLSIMPPDIFLILSLMGSVLVGALWIFCGADAVWGWLIISCAIGTGILQILKLANIIFRE